MTLKWTDCNHEHSYWTAANGLYVSRFVGLNSNGLPRWKLEYRENGKDQSIELSSFAQCRSAANKHHSSK